MSNSVQLGGIYEEGYGIVPKKMFKAKNIGKNEKLILSYFLSYTGAGKDSCFPSINLICEDLDLSKGTVVQAIKNCVHEGFIRKERLHPDNPLNHANKYVILFGNSDGSMVRTSKVQTSDGSTFELTMVQPLEQNNNNINNTSSSPNGSHTPLKNNSIRSKKSDFRAPLIARYNSEYERVYGMPNAYIFKRYEYVNASQLLAEYGDKIYDAVTAYLNDKWAKDNGGHTFGSFVKNVERWINAAQSKRPAVKQVKNVIIQ